MDRPTSVTVFGVFNTCYGILCLCMVVLGLVVQALFYMGLWQYPNMPAEALDVPALQRVYSIISTILSIGLSTLLMVTGAGLLGGKAWARSGSVLYAKLAAAVVVINTIITVGITLLASDAMYEATGVPITQDQIDFAKRMSVVGMFIVALVQLLHCGLTYRFMTEKHVIAWFEKAEWDGDDGLEQANG